MCAFFLCLICILFFLCKSLENQSLTRILCTRITAKQKTVRFSWHAGYIFHCCHRSLRSEIRATYLFYSPWGHASVVLDSKCLPPPQNQSTQPPRPGSARVVCCQGPAIPSLGMWRRLALPLCHSQRRKATTRGSAQRRATAEMGSSPSNRIASPLYCRTMSPQLNSFFFCTADDSIAPQPPHLPAQPPDLPPNARCALSSQSDSPCCFWHFPPMLPQSFSPQCNSVQQQWAFLLVCGRNQSSTLNTRFIGGQWWWCGGGGGGRVALPGSPLPPRLMEAAQRTTQRSTPEPAEAHSETCQHTKARSTQYSRTKQGSVPQQWRRTATPPAASTSTSPTPNALGGGQTHHTGSSPTHSRRRPQTRHTHKPQRQAPGARNRPRQWVGGPIQALRRLPEFGPNRSGPARVAAAATPHGGSIAHNAEAA